MRWSQNPDFLDFTDRITSLYGYLDTELALGELDRRMAMLSQFEDGYAYLDTALLASVIPKKKNLAIDCFAEALKEAELEANPFVHALEARAWLSMEQLDRASEGYEKAIELAAKVGDPALVFRLRQMCVSDFFLKNRVQMAIEAGLPTLESDYPIERAWGLSQKALYYWSEGETEISIQAVAELQELYPTVEPRSDFDWQRRKYEDIGETLQILQGAVSQDPVAEIALAVEALDYSQRSGNLRSGLAQLKPIVEEYPVEDYATWTDPELRDWLIWAQYNYWVGLSRVTGREEAIQGLEGLVSTVPFDDYPARVAECWLWLGWLYQLEGDFEEASSAYEQGFSLDVSGLPVAGAESAFPKHFTQPRVMNAHTNPDQRALFVAGYEQLLRTLDSAGEAGQ